MLRKERKWNHIKYSIKTIKGRKRVEDKNRNKERGNKQIIVINMVNINPTISITTLKFNNQNEPLKERLSEWIKIHGLTIPCL